MKRLILIFVSIFLIVFASQAATFTVTTNADTGPGTLRQALADVAAVNTNVGGHTIIFSTGMTITLNNSLSIYNDADFNGLTVNGFVDGTAGPDVIIRSNNSCGIRGFDINASITNMKFYGLVFQNVDYGIFFNANVQGTANGSEIKGCYFGTDVTGASIVGSICRSGVELIGTSSVTIGGTGATLANGAASSSNNAERCIFGGTCWNNDNEMHGAVHLVSSNNVSITNSYIGVNAAGTTKLSIGDPAQKWARAKHGIYLTNSTGTIIDRNVVSGAVGAGIYVDGGGNNTIIKGNIIGLNAAGTAGYNVTTPANSFGNQATGIYLNNVSGCIIGYNGGVIANERNIIGANGGADHTYAGCDRAWDFNNQFGIYAEGITNCQFKGNYIGTDITGMNSGTATNILYNRTGGIKIIGKTNNSTNNIIGGTTANEINVISGHGAFWNKPTGLAINTCTPPQSNDLSYITGGDGIILQHAGTTGNTVSGNYLGLASDGITALGNLLSGIQLQGATNNTIGGTTAASRNYICDNRFGIMLQEDFDVHVAASNNTILGNWIGLNTAGISIGNGINAASNAVGEGGGILIQMGANNNKIGTAVTGGGNVISGNRSGIVIRNAEQNGTGAARTNTIYNNIIGLDPTGTSAMPNASVSAGYGYGIQIEIGSSGTTIPFGNIIGGTAANQPNTISSNQKSGIYINSTTAVTASTANSIVGNKIGTNAAGTGSFGNTQGIEIVNVSKTTITSNIISRNSQNGISLTGTTTNSISSNTITANSVNGIFGSSASTNTITGNTISTNGSNGLSLTGSSSNTIQTNTINSNTSNGISLVAGSASNIIGGIVSGEANTINTNGANGVLVDVATSINNSIHQNSFSCNTLRGIVLSNGGNGGIQTATITGSNTQLTYTNPNPFATRIEIFETDGCATCPADPTRLQGKTFVTSGNIAANGTFAFTTALTFSPAKLYTAILHQGTNITTTAARNSSEFTQCYTLCQNPTSVTITGSPLTFCAGGSVTLTANVVGGSGTETYVWKNGTTIVGTNSPTYVATTGGSYTVEYSSTTTCTPTPSTAVTVTVNPRPTVTSSSTGTVCSGTAQNYTITASVPSTFAWTRAVVAGISNTAGSGTTSTITETLINTTTAPVNVVYSITPTSTTGSCAATAPFTYTVTVNPKPAISSPATGTVCSGTAQNYTITSATASTYSWSRAAVAGISNAAVTNNSANPITETLINTTNAAVNVVYTITPTATTGGCAGDAFTYTVTVNPKPVITSSGTGTVCSGTAQNYTITSNTASGFSWTRAVVAGISNTAGSGTTSTITETLINTTNAAVTVAYTITPTATTGGCTGDAFTYTVTVNPKPAITSSATGTVCSGSAQNYTITSGAAATYSWSRAAVAGISNAAVTNNSSSPITEILINTTNAAVNVVYTITPTSTTGGCAGDAFTYTVTVNPKPVITSSGTGTICSADAQNYTITSSTSSGFSWTRAVVAGISNAAGSGTTSSITEALTNTTNAAINVVYTITPTSTTGGCAGDAFTYTVTVNPRPTVTSTATGNICSGDAQNYTITSSSASGFSWTRAVVTGISNAAGSGTTNTITEALTNTTNAAINVVYTITPTSTTGGCAGDAFTYTVTVNPKPTVTSAATGSICSGVAQNYTITSDVASGFSWSRAAVTGIDNAAASGSSATINETLINSTNASITVEYLITPSSTAGSCAGNQFSYIVTVDPKPVVTINNSGSTAFCSNQSVSLSASANGFTGGTFEWFDANNASLGNANPLVVNTAGTFKVVYTTTSSCSSSPSSSVSTSINPNNSFVAIGADYSTCNSAIELEGNIPPFGTGSWSVVTPSSATVTPLTGTATTVRAEADNLIDGNIYKFVYTVSGACGPDQTDTITVTAGLTGFEVTASGPSDTLCYKTNRYLNARAVGGSGNYSYVWVSSDKSFSGKVNAANIVVQPTRKEVTYTVYVIDNLNVGCKTDLDSVKVHAFENQDLYLPNLITPNGDELNDRFILRDKVTHQDMLKDGSHLEVVNRWGSKVYEADNYDNSWVPKDLTDGMYYYHITNQCGNKEYKSWLQILGNKNN